jgi:oligo-alginate lyase
VQYGGWESPRANWYKSTAAHNTVWVDGANQPGGAGASTLFAQGDGFAAVSADAPGLVPGGKRYARTVALIDTSPEHSYVLDVFRVIGGKDHLKGFSSHFSSVTTSLEKPDPATDLVHPQMRNWQAVRKAPAGWWADFKVQDRYKLLASPKDVHLRHTDLSMDADAYVGEAWVVEGTYSATAETWIPRVVTRRRAQAAPLASTFAAVLDLYVGTPVVAGARRLAVAQEDSVCAIVELADGRKDHVVSSPAAGTAVEQPDNAISTDAALAVLRVGADGKPVMVVLCGASRFNGAGVEVELSKATEFVQLAIDGAGVKVVKGDAAAIRRVSVAGRDVTPTR